LLFEYLVDGSGELNGTWKMMYQTLKKTSEIA
jgi:hypothetical protein